MTMPEKVIDTVRVSDMGEQREILVRVRELPSECVRSTVFLGTAHGVGRTYMRFGSDWVHVSDPARFGDTFDEQWARRFFEDAWRRQ